MDAPAPRTCRDSGLVELRGGVSTPAKVLQDEPIVARHVAHAEGPDGMFGMVTALVVTE